MKKRTPATTPIVTGVVITTAEAMETRNPIIGFPAVDLKERFHDLPQLPDRNR